MQDIINSWLRRCRGILKTRLWLRRKLRLMDLDDLRKKRRTLGKTAYTARVKQVLKTKKAQTVAKNVAGRFRKVCKQVVDRGGAAADNGQIALRTSQRDACCHCLDLLD
eukprot:6627834-Pyramimonas_sp.AAC.1